MGVCIITPILVGLISAYLGYLLGNHDQKIQKHIIDNLEKEIGILNSELTAIKNKKKKEKKDIDIPFNPQEAKKALGKTIRENDLKIIEGIGPKIESLLHSHNITTWLKLSQTPAKECQEILNSGGYRFKMHKPDEWPKQALYAYQGKWEKLKSWPIKNKGNNIKNKHL